MIDSPWCQHLPWDSAFFGRRIARLKKSRLDLGCVDASLAWCRAERIDCLYLLADLSDAATVRLAEDNGFHLVDVRVTLDTRLGIQHPVPPDSEPESVRPWRASDCSALKAIARTAHVDSRFYTDPFFPSERCADLYETWLIKNCCGGKDTVLAADLRGQPAGYVSCHTDQDRGEISLLAVAGSAQGCGLGGKLVRAALGWFARNDIDDVRVVTQGRNIRAQRLYQRAGFLTRDVQLWFHRWFTVADARHAA